MRDCSLQLAHIWTIELLTRGRAVRNYQASGVSVTFRDIWSIRYP